MRVLVLVAAVSVARVASAQETPAPTPPVAEERPHLVYVELTGGRRTQGTLLGRDDEAHWIETADGVVRVRTADVAAMSDTPPAATAILPERWDPRPLLTIAGSILFGLAYLGAVSGIDDGGEDGLHLAIPVLGPFAFAMVVGTGAEQAGLLTFASFVQAGGLAMLTFGIVGGPPAPFTRLPE